MSSNASVSEILKKQLEDTRDEYQRAKGVFNVIICNLPSGLPHPDGKLSIEEAGRSERAALQAYTRAMERLSDFVMTGRVPADLDVESDPTVHNDTNGK